MFTGYQETDFGCVGGVWDIKAACSVQGYVWLDSSGCSLCCRTSLLVAYPYILKPFASSAREGSYRTRKWTAICSRNSSRFIWRCIWAVEGDDISPKSALSRNLKETPMHQPGHLPLPNLLQTPAKSTDYLLRTSRPCPWRRSKTKTLVWT